MLLSTFRRRQFVVEFQPKFLINRVQQTLPNLTFTHVQFYEVEQIPQTSVYFKIRFFDFFSGFYYIAAVTAATHRVVVQYFALNHTCTVFRTKHRG